MGYISTWMGDHLSDLFQSLMALRIVLVDQNPFRPISSHFPHSFNWFALNDLLLPSLFFFFVCLFFCMQSSVLLPFECNKSEYLLKVRIKSSRISIWIIFQEAWPTNRPPTLCKNITYFLNYAHRQIDRLHYNTIVSPL